MKVFIRTLTGKTFQVSIEEDAKIVDLKEKVYDQEGQPVGTMKLVFAGRCLEDKNQISDYNIEEDCVIHMLNKVK